MRISSSFGAPCGIIALTLRNYRNGVDLDEIVGRRHLRNLDHGGGRKRRLEIFPAHFVDGFEMLHVAHVDVHAADIIERSAGSLDRRLDVLADLPSLCGDVAYAGDASIGSPRGHPRDEDKPAL